MSPSDRRVTPIDIERWSSEGADPATSAYILTFGGTIDGVGTVLLSKLKGLLAMREFLESLASFPLTSIRHAECSRKSRATRFQT